MTYAQSRYRDNIVLGLCGSCGRDPEPGFATCLKCRQGHIRRRKALKARRRTAGLCTQCGHPLKGKKDAEASSESLLA